MGSGMSGSKKFFLFFVVGLLIAFLGFFYAHREKFHFPKIKKLPVFQDSSSAGSVRCFVISNVGQSTYLRLKLAIPCRGKDEREDLESKLPRLKHEFLMTLGEPETEQFIRQRNLEAIRKQLLKVINRNAEKPVDHLYIEGFYFN